MTSFSTVINAFLGKITDDMYMELTKEETERHAQEYILMALPFFEFPRKNIMNYSEENSTFNVSLDNDEINIIATYMVVAWLDQQLASIEVVRQKYSGSDYKFTSQAQHLSKVQNLRAEYERIGFHLQRVYKRRLPDDEGIMTSTMSDLRYNYE